MTLPSEIVPSPVSFRDAAAFVVSRKGQILRYLTPAYLEHYHHLMQSGLYSRLVEAGLLISHVEKSRDDTFTVIEPELVPFISYPYEWSFSQLKAAAIATLKIQQQALDMAMTLKDASAYNIQFVDGKPLLIDTASFERYQEGKPWIAYGQFCRHFLAPLAIMCRKDIRLQRLLQGYLDGVPLDLAASLLPFGARLNAGIAYHIILHAAVDAATAGHRIDKAATTKKLSFGAVQVSKRSLVSQTEHLMKAVEQLELPNLTSHWSTYYKENNYCDLAFEHKKSLVGEFLDLLTPAPRMLFDLGANTGVFSRIAAGKQILTIALDLDPICIDLNYRECIKLGERQVLPLVVDLTNPSPPIGFANQERQSLTERGPADAALALALIHHLAIANAVPLALVAKFMASLCHSLIIEFVPKEDSQVKRLLPMGEDTFPQYTKEGFETAFSTFFKIQRSEALSGSARTLYLMCRNTPPAVAAPNERALL